MDVLSVTVLEVTDSLKTLTDGVPPSVDLGRSGEAFLREIVAEGIQCRLRMQRGCKAFIIRWSGGRAPIGAQIDGRTIGWTQHGIVRTPEGEPLGTYNRLSDRSDDRRMLVFIDPS